MDIILTINKRQRLAYIPKVLYEVLGSKVKATPNRAAVLMFSAEMNINDVLRSIDIIKADLLHAKQLQKQPEDQSILTMPKTAVKILD